MSEMERRSGTIRELDIDMTLPWIEQLQQVRYQLSEIEDVFEECYEDTQEFYSEYVAFIDNRWWALDQKRHDPSEGFATMKRRASYGTEEYTFDCQWYNGGAGFEEVLEQAFENRDKL